MIRSRLSSPLWHHLRFVDIQNTGGVSLDEAFDGQIIVCGADASHPEDALSWTYTWNNDAGDITIDPAMNVLTLDYAGQGMTGGESVTCTATVTMEELPYQILTVLFLWVLSICDRDPYDGIDSNCDGLEI